MIKNRVLECLCFITAFFCLFTGHVDYATFFLLGAVYFKDSK